MKLPAFFYGKRRGLFTRLIANGIAQAGLAIFFAMLVRKVFAFLAASRDATAGLGDSQFPWMVAGLVAATGASAVLRVFERQDAVRLAENYVKRIRLRLFDALTAGPVLSSKRRSLGPMMLRFVTDLTAVRQWVANGLSRLIVASLAVTGGLIAVFMIDHTMGGAVLMFFALTIFVGVLLGNTLEHRIRQTRRRRSRLAAKISDRLQLLNVVQLSGQVRRERRAISRNSSSLGDAAVARARISSIIRVMPNAALGFSLVAVLVIGGMQLAASTDAYGSIIAVLAVLGAISPQARALGRVFEYWKTYQVASGKLNDILSGAQRSHNRKKIVRAKPSSGAISFERVTVNGALDGINAKAASQSLIAIVGPSGAGKSSLLAAAGRLLEFDQGRILLGGDDITSFTDNTFAATTGIISADFPLVRGSILENITYRNKQASEDDIRRALDICELEDEIEKLPKGLKTRIGDGRAAFAMGLRQRLALARAIMGDPAVLLLDDPDGGLDPAGQRALDRILAARRSTVLMATHRLDRVRGSDCVWFMENGRLVENGPPSALLDGTGPTSVFFRLTEQTGPGPTLIWSSKQAKGTSSKD